MNTNHKNVQTAILGVGAALFALFLLVKPDYFFKSALNGLSLYVTTVLPALFPFYFCATLLTKIGAAEVCSIVMKKPIKFLFNAPPESAFAIVCSLLCGYPVGAAALNSLYLEGYLDEDGVRRAMPVCSTSGPLFMLGTVGSALFHNAHVGAVVLVSHIIGTFICGVVFRGFKLPKNKQFDDKITPKSNATETKKSSPKVADLNSLENKLYGKENALSESVSKATLSMLYLGGYIVLASMLADCVLLIPYLNNAPAEIKTLMQGVIEMTRGCVCAVDVSYLPYAVALCTFIITLGGLCICMQSCSYLIPCGIKTSRYLLCKLCQATAAGLVSLLLGFAIV